jgi:hypothetical protein
MAKYTPSQWREVLRTSLAEEAFGRRLAEASLAGRPLGKPNSSGMSRILPDDGFNR